MLRSKVCLGVKCVKKQSEFGSRGLQGVVQKLRRQDEVGGKTNDHDCTRKVGRYSQSNVHYIQQLQFSIMIPNFCQLLISLLLENQNFLSPGHFQVKIYLILYNLKWYSTTEDKNCNMSSKYI